MHAVAKYYGSKRKFKRLQAELGTNPDTGTTVVAMQESLREMGLAAPSYASTTIRKLTKHLSKGVAILHVDGNHFMVVHGRKGKFFYIMDPLGKPDRISIRTLSRRWHDGWAIMISGASNEAATDQIP